MKRLLMAITLVAVLSVTALAGDMPGGGRSGEMPGGGISAPAEMPGVGGSITGEIPTGEMPGIGSSTSSGTESSLVTTLLLTFITLIGR